MASREQLIRNSEALRDADRAVAERQDQLEHPRRQVRSGNNRLLLAVTLGTAIVVGAIASLSVGSWWLMGVALLLHAAGTIVVTAVTGSLVARQDKPSPTEVAHAEAQSSRTDADLEA